MLENSSLHFETKCYHLNCCDGREHIKGAVLAGCRDDPLNVFCLWKDVASFFEKELKVLQVDAEEIISKESR